MLLKNASAMGLLGLDVHAPHPSAPLFPGVPEYREKGRTMMWCFVTGGWIEYDHPRLHYAAPLRGLRSTQRAPAVACLCDAQGSLTWLLVNRWCR
jgi:hypothetical protein